MAGKSTISITFKLDADGKGFKDLSKDAEGFKTAVSSVVSEAQKLNAGAINFAAVATGIDQMQQSIQALHGALKGLTDAYALQIEAETKLATNMRNTMGASDEDIKSIKDLCAAQQELGVIGDEVQLAGAQELATYLEERKSLETLIPVLNDMVAQQYGLNATQESAAQIATMLGKVMEGQTKALSRYGYSFDAAQEKILKFGTEEERAATLAEVVEASVGGVNQALAQTDVGKQKQLENTLGDIKEKMGGLVQGAMPFLTIAANTTLALSGVVKFTMGVKAATAAAAAWNIKAKVLNATLLLSGLNAKKAAQATRVLTVANRSAAASAVALKLAIRGLLISTVVGAAIAALTAIVEHFVNAADEATDSTNDLLDATGRAKRKAEDAEEQQRAEATALKNTTAALKIDIATLKDFHGTKQKEKKLVEEMNDTYGESMGYYKTVSDWYKALVANSEAYCRQMVLEAKTRNLASRIAEKEQENHNLIYDDKGAKKTYSKKRDTETFYTTEYNSAGQLYSKKNTRELPGTSELEKVEATVKSNQQEITELNKQLTDAVKEAGALTMAVHGSATRPDLTGGNNTKKEKTRLQELNDLINKAKDSYLTASAEEREGIVKNIAAWSDEAEQIKLTQAQLDRPTTLATLEDIDKEISYQQQLRRKASTEDIAGIDAEIKRLGRLRSAMESNAHTAIPIEKIESYQQLSEELKYYNALLETATTEERTEIQKQINALNDLKKTWDDMLEELKRPADISALNTIEELDNAISYYQQKQQKQSADEIANTQQVIDKLEAKRRVLMLSAEIPTMQKEISDTGRLSKKELKVKIKAMGFEELTRKIKDLQKLLDDTSNPVTDNQRKDIQRMIATYEDWRKQSVHTFGTMREGYEGLKGMGDGVQSIADAIEGSGNAWQKTTAIIDGFLQIYDGIQSIVGIINMLSAASTAHASAKGVEAGAETTEATARGVSTAANAEASAVQIAANKLETASWTELAAAEYMAAHAAIPFVGFAIAADYTAAMEAAVIAAGVPKFAEGGIAYGPTLGIFGEYAGAGNNPEVVAPLDKLRTLIQPTDGGVGKVEFVLEGRVLRGVLNRVDNLSKRS
jgi:hypothetical protein